MVVGADADDQRHLLDDVETEFAQLRGLLGVVREQADLRDAEIAEDAGRSRILARISRQAEGEIRVDRVEPALLQAVGAQLVDQPDAAALVPAHVDDDAAVLFDGVQRRIQLRPALALQRSERLTGQALRVHPHQCRLTGLTGDNGDVIGAGHAVLISEEAEDAVIGRHRGIRSQADPTLAGTRRRHGTVERICLVEVRDELLDRDDRHTVAFAELFEPREPHHAAVFGDDLCDRTDRLQADELHEVDGRLGVAAALTHAAVDSAQRQHMAGADHARRGRCRVREHVERARAVGRTDAGGHAVCGIDADRVRRRTGVLIGLDHGRQIQRIGEVGGHRCADEAGRPAHRPRDPLGGGELGREDDIALVLAVLVVGDDDGATGSQRLEGFFDGGKAHLEPPSETARNARRRST